MDLLQPVPLAQYWSAPNQNPITMFILINTLYKLDTVYTLNIKRRLTGD